MSHIHHITLHNLLRYLFISEAIITIHDAENKPKTTVIMTININMLLNLNVPNDILRGIDLWQRDCISNI
jgi:hypothetical protein